MRVLIVYGSQFGTTEHLAREMGAAISVLHDVDVVPAHEAEDLLGAGYHLLVVGAPTQFKGHRLLARGFLKGLEAHGFGGVAAAAFDTRAHGDRGSTGSAAEAIALLLSQGRLQHPRAGRELHGGRAARSARRRGAGACAGVDRGPGALRAPGAGRVPDRPVPGGRPARQCP